MDPGDIKTRRATVDDLPDLQALWRDQDLPAEALEKRLTEFHLVADASGRVLGAIALQVSGQSGKLHTETLGATGDPDTLRRRLWEHVESVAKHRGLIRLWTHLSSSFWHESGFKEASSSEKERLPAQFGGPDLAWRTLQLRDEAALESVLQRELELFKIQNEERNQRVMRNAKLLRGIAILLGIVLFLLVLLGLVALVQLSPGSE